MICDECGREGGGRHYRHCRVPIREAAREFPETFSLKSFPDRLFAISVSHSYISDDGTVTIYLAVQTDKHWEAFGKASVEELRQNILV